MPSFVSSRLAHASPRTKTSKPERRASSAVWKTHISVAAPATSTLSTPSPASTARNSVPSKAESILEKDWLAVCGSDFGDELARLPLLDRLADDLPGLRVLTAVVRVHDRHSARPGLREKRHEDGVPTAIAFEQSVAVLVVEVLEHVDEKEGFDHPEVFPAPSPTCNLSLFGSAKPSQPLFLDTSSFD